MTPGASVPPSAPLLTSRSHTSSSPLAAATRSRRAARSDVYKRQLESQHTTLRRELTERYPAYAELVSPRPPSPADIQKVLLKDEAAVAIYVAEQKTYVWTITPTLSLIHI